MAQIIVEFPSEQEARRVMAHLEQANVGEVRMRVLHSSQGTDYPRTENTSPMVTSDMGSVEVRPSETPETPESEHESGQEASASIPTTGSGQGGVQVMIEVDDRYEEEVRRLLRKTA